MQANCIRGELKLLTNLSFLKKLELTPYRAEQLLLGSYKKQMKTCRKKGKKKSCRKPKYKRCLLDLYLNPFRL